MSELSKAAIATILGCLFITPVPSLAEGLSCRSEIGEKEAARLLQQFECHPRHAHRAMPQIHAGLFETKFKEAVDFCKKQSMFLNSVNRNDKRL
jgi:hypothetical protein